MHLGGLVLGIERVLCSTAHLHRQAWEAVLTAFDIPCDGIMELDFSALDRRQSIETLLQRSNNIHLSAIERDTLISEKNDLYRNLLCTLSPDALLPGVRAFLDELKGEGLSLGVATTSKNAVLILKYLGFADYFDAVSDGNDLCDGDSRGLVYLKTCEYMGLPPKQCLVWEGVAQKVQEARAAGLYAVLGSCEDVRALLLSTPMLEKTLEKVYHRVV